MNINGLLDRFRSDPAFAAKYRNLTDVNEIQAQLKSDGYDVSLDDVRAGIGEFQGTSGELSEAELAGVAGGSGVDANGKKCPQCGSKNLSYGPRSSASKHYTRTVTCNDCGYSEVEEFDDPIVV